MPTRRILDSEDIPTWKRNKCSHPEHGPPTMMVFKPGTYEHECPACGKKTTFTVRAACWASDRYEREDIPDDIGIARRFTVGDFALHAKGDGS